jgi:homoserine kinase type II
MAVFTEVGFGEADALVQRLGLGPLRELRGIEGGIENTNYFATTESGEFVLTLFERLSAEQLPYYLCLMKHLAAAGLPVPAPVAGARGREDEKGPDGPALRRHRLRPAPPGGRQARGRGAEALGPQRTRPGAAHCAELGAMLARMHLAGRDYPRIQPNLRGLPWWNETVPVVLPYIEEAQAGLLRAELAYQNHVAESSAYAALPRGPVHADMFRDNVMFATGDSADAAPRLTGVFDFYFAGTDTWLFDLAVCLNDWAIDLPTGRHDAERAEALLSAYEACAR